VGGWSGGKSKVEAELREAGIAERVRVDVAVLE